MPEGATLGGDEGFVLGGGDRDGGTLGQTPYIAQRHRLSAESRETTSITASTGSSLTGTFEG